MSAFNTKSSIYGPTSVTVTTSQQVAPLLFRIQWIAPQILLHLHKRNDALSQKQLSDMLSNGYYVIEGKKVSRSYAQNINEKLGWNDTSNDVASITYENQRRIRNDVRVKVFYHADAVSTFSPFVDALTNVDNSEHSMSIRVKEHGFYYHRVGFRPNSKGTIYFNKERSNLAGYKTTYCSQQYSIYK